jgi:hypothetical protein
MWARDWTDRGGHGWRCRGAYGGNGGWTALRSAHPGWRLRRRFAAAPFHNAVDAGDERRELEAEAELLETELRRIRNRIEQLHDTTTSGS